MKMYVDPDLMAQAWDDFLAANRQDKVLMKRRETVINRLSRLPREDWGKSEEDLYSRNQCLLCMTAEEAFEDTFGDGGGCSADLDKCDPQNRLSAKLAESFE